MTDSDDALSTHASSPATRVGGGKTESAGCGLLATPTSDGETELARRQSPAAPASGSQTAHAACVGIVMLDTRFPRILGDIGNAATWPFPVLYQMVRGASPEDAVRTGVVAVEPFIAAARHLVAAGADGIATSCGFLSPLQDQLAEAVGVPVVASSLLQVPLVNRMLPPGKRAGILTIASASLSEAHLHAAGVPPGTPIEGTDAGDEFSRVILEDQPSLDVRQARADLLDAGTRLLRRHPEVGALVLECTNMTPYAADLRALGVPIYSIYTLVQWFQAGLQPRRFAPAHNDPFREE